MIYRYLSRPFCLSARQMSVPLGYSTTVCAMHRLMNCQELVSKYRLKNGILLRVLAISMPSKGIFYCQSLVSTLQICSSSPLTSKLKSSIYIMYDIQLQSVAVLFYYVMDKADLVALITARSHKLKALREQAANGNEQKKRLYMGALLYLLQEKRTQSPAYEEITQLLVTASPFIANAVDQQLAPSLIQLHSQSTLDDYLILWGRMCDGSLPRKEYPDFRQRFEKLRIKNIQKQLTPVFKNYLLQFEKNFNQRHDQRVEFFEDFDDSVSQSMENDSQLMNVIYLSIMEVKAARKKLEQKLSDEALNQQLTKLRHFLSIKLPPYLSEHERKEFQKEREWVRRYLDTKEEEKRENPSVSINETLVLQGEQQQIQIIKNEPKPRLFKSKDPLNRQFFQDSLQVSEKKDPFKKLKAGLPHHQSLPTPIKLIDPRYAGHTAQEITSRNSSLEINNGNRSLPYDNLKPLVEQNKDDLIEEEVVIHKLKPGTHDPLKAKPLPDFSVTQNYFKKSQRELLSPRGAQSRTGQGWGQSGYLSPSKHSRCKLSKFTSEKKVRKEIALKNQISTAEPHVIQPYLQNFTNVSDYNRFRRQCFENSVTLHASDLLVAKCMIEREANSRVLFEVTFLNNSNVPLEVEIVYKVPQCYSIEKRSKISKRFQLHTSTKHIFCLGADQFPLQPCMVSLKARTADNLASEEGMFPFPVTLLNFIEYLCVSQEEWVKQWNSINTKESQQFYFFAKHIEMERGVIGEDFDWLLRDLFVRVANIEGLSVQDYGCVCFYPGLHGLRFLVHLSVRVDNILSLQASSCRLVTKDEKEFIEYCLNLWMMLLGKLYI